MRSSIGPRRPDKARAPEIRPQQPELGDAVGTVSGFQSRIQQHEGLETTDAALAPRSEVVHLIHAPFPPYVRECRSPYRQRKDPGLQTRAVAMQAQPLID